MLPEDEAEFEDQVKRIEGAVLQRGKVFDEIVVDDVPIQYLHSEQKDSTLSAGRIAIATTDKAGEATYPNFAAAESAYKKLRAWLRKNYNNNLVGYSEYFPLESRVVMVTKNFWLGPHAAKWHEFQNGTLRQFHSGAVVFMVPKEDRQ